MLHSLIGRHRRVAAAAVVLVALLVAAPVVAFVIVPLFVRATLHEAPPPTTAAVSRSATVPSPNDAPAATPAPLSGQLRHLDPVHYGTGRVLIVDAGGERYLRFENVDIAGAPNLFVYLSDRNDGQPGSYTDLGPLKATNGSFNYQIGPDVDLQRVHSVVIWCRAFSITVTYAVLERATA